MTTSNCLPEIRLQQLDDGGTLTNCEQKHVKSCKLCAHIVAHAADNCIQMPRLLELSFGSRLATEERQHIKECPVCRWSVRQIRTNSP